MSTPTERKPRLWKIISCRQTHEYHPDSFFSRAALSAENRAKIFEGNARKVYGRLDGYLDRRSRL
jgi:hypothetical protein